MFGADIGQLSMLDAGRGTDNGGLDRLEYLLPQFHQQLPWKHDQKQIVEDFILIAEFSEQEGPRPVIVIPDGGGKHFDQNEFSVKILAVDHQSSIVEGCHMTEDAQVVMADCDQGAYAFIHHIVLNDIQARGYVRPFCITYVTTDSMKIMKCYEKLSFQLKEVARLMKFGNRLVFMRDLEKRLEDLDYTKTQLLISQSRAQTSNQGDSELLNTLNTIRQSMEEVKDILASVKKQLMDKELEERFQVYERRLKANLQRNVEDGETASLKEYSSSEQSVDGEMSGSYTCSSEFSLFNKSKDLKPKLLDVSTIGGKRRFDRSLRGLHELCSWGAKEGLQKLRFIRQGLKRDLSSIMMEDFDYSIMSPYSGVLSFGCSSVGASFLSACNSSKDVCCLKKKIGGMGDQFIHISSLDSFKSLPSSYQSFLDDETMYSVNSSVVGSLYERQNSDQGFDEYGITFDADELVTNERKAFESTLRNSLTQTVTRLNTNITSKTGEQFGRDSDVSEYDSISIDKDLKCVARGCSCEETSKKVEGVGCTGARGNNCCDTVGVKHRKNESKCELNEHEYECNRNDIILNKDLKNMSKQVECDCENCYDDSKKHMALQIAKHASEIFESVNASEDDMGAMETDNQAMCVGLTESTSTLTDLNLAKSGNAFAEVSEHYEIDGSKEMSDQENNDLFELYDEGREDIVTPQPSTFLDTTCDETSVINNCNKSDINTTSAKSQNESELNMTGNDKTVNDLKVSEITNKDISIPREGSISTWPKTKPEIEDSGTDLLSHSLSCSSGDMPDTSDLRLMYSKGGFSGNVSKTSDTESLRSSIDGQQSLARKRLRLNSHSFTTDADDVTVNCVQRVLTCYNNLQHVIYSLLAGKPVVVIATEKHEAAMKELVKALSVFTPVVPGCSVLRLLCFFIEYRTHQVRGANIGLVCQIKQLKVAEVRKFQLRGMIRHDRRAVDFLIPLSVRRYLTLVDLDKMLVYCHPYQGPLLNFICAIHHKRISLKSDQALFRFIQMQLLEISTKAFIFYHNISSVDKELDFSGATLLRKSFMLELSAEKYLNQTGHVSSDYRIIKHLSEIVKIQQIEEEFRAKFLTDAPVHPFRIAYQSMQTYRM